MYWVGPVCLRLIDIGNADPVGVKKIIKIIKILGIIFIVKQ